MENLNKKAAKSNNENGSNLIFVVLLMILGFGRAALNGLNSTSGIVFLLLGIGWLFVLISESNKSS